MITNSVFVAIAAREREGRVSFGVYMIVKIYLSREFTFQMKYFILNDKFYQKETENDVRVKVFI